MTNALAHVALALTLVIGASSAPVALAQEEGGPDDPDLFVRERPPLVSAQTAKAIQAGARYLAQCQSANGSWLSGGRSGQYPAAMTALAGMALVSVGHTPTRGMYAPQVRKAVEWTLKCQTGDGVYTGPGEMRNMYGHGFSMMFLGTVYGNTSDRALQKRIHVSLKKAVALTVKAQSQAGGWYYTPESNTDEGSVTVTQMQGLRAARIAGVDVSEQVMKKAVNYLKQCQMPDGGICYSLRSRGGSRPAISAAAVSCLYSAGAYDHPMADKCYAYCKAQFGRQPYNGSFFFYTNFYWAQAVYQKGGKEWSVYYPQIQKLMLTGRYRSGSSWNGNGFGGGTGPVYGTSLALMILTLPYKNIPVFGR